MSTPSLKAIIESILFASETPLNAGELLKVILRVDEEKESEMKSEAESSEVPLETSQETPVEERTISVEDQLLQAQSKEESRLARSDIQQALGELVFEYESNLDRGFILTQVAGGYQFRTRPEVAVYLKAMNKVAPTRLSPASLETLAIVAYRQPIIRAEIDQIRGVDSGGVLKTLLDRGLIRIVGKKDEAGKPILYGTTDQFLEVFNLKNLQELPTLKDLAQIEEEMKAQSASQQDVVSLDSEDDSFEDVAIDFSERFHELEKEEEEAFLELEKEMADLKQFDEKVSGTLNPKPVLENVSEEIIPTSQDSHQPS